MKLSFSVNLYLKCVLISHVICLVKTLGSWINVAMHTFEDYVIFYLAKLGFVGPQTILGSNMAHPHNSGSAVRPF